MKTNFNVQKSIHNSRSIGLIVLALLFGSLHMWGATASFIWCTTGQTMTTTSGTQGNIDLSSASNSASAPAVSSNQLRLYYHSSGNGGSVTVTAQTGYQITAVSIYSTLNPTLGYKINNGSYSTKSWSSTSSYNANYTASLTSLTATSVTFQNQNTTNTHIRITALIVTYEATGGSTYTVTYDKNDAGASGTMTDSDSPYSSGATVTVLDNGFTAPSGKVFDHWNTAANDGGTDYDPDDTFTISGNTTLYAQWVDAPAGGSGDFVLVESTPDSWEGEYLIVYNNTNAMNTHNGNANTNTYATYTDISSYYSAKTIESNNTTEALVYVVEESTNGYTIKRKAATEYLGYNNATSGGSNGAYLRWDGTITANQNEWTLGVGSIVSVYNSEKAIRWNDGSPRFAIYATNGQSAIQLFKRVDTHTYTNYRTTCEKCSMSGNIYVTAYNGRGIMAATPLSLAADGIAGGSPKVTLSSNSGDVYFSADRNANFLKSAPYLPTTTLDVNADGSGDISTTVYVHYKPSTLGTGAASDVTITATPSDGSGNSTHTIHVRNMPEKFVVAGKVGPTWYALPANISGSESTPAAVAIEVNEATMTATAPTTCTYTLWPVKTHATASSDRYALYSGNAYGEHIRLAAVSVDRKGLWAGNGDSPTKIKTANEISGLSSAGEAPNEWKITTTVTDGVWHYKLQSNQSNHTGRYLGIVLPSAALSWATYVDGAEKTNDLYFLPVTETEEFDAQVIEWYPTKVLIQTNNAITSPTVSIDGTPVASPTCTSKGTKWYEIGNLPLTDKKPHTMTIKYTADAKNYSTCLRVPIIIWEDQTLATEPIVASIPTLTEPFASITNEVYSYADLVVRDGATFTLNGTKAQNVFWDVTIYPTAKISLPELNLNNQNNYIGVHSLTFFGGIDEIYNGSGYTTNKYGVPEFSFKGKCDHKTVHDIDYIMRVDQTQMYSITVPYSVCLNDIKYWDGTAMPKGTNLWVSAYDGQARADKSGSTWVYETDFATKFSKDSLVAGVGYTISAEMQSGVGSNYALIRMPMKHPFTGTSPNDVEKAKSVAVTAFTAAGVTDNNKGWNLVGNPYMTSISGSTAGGASNTKLYVGYLVPDGTAWSLNNDSYRYVTIPYDSGDGYEQTKWSSATLKPFKNFFIQVQTSGSLAFALASRNNMPARYLQTQEREVEFEVTLTNGDKSDNFGLLIAEEYSSAYEGNADLEKMEGVMCVYTIFGGYKLAYNALNPTEAAGSIPVGYIANVAGSYTFSYDTGDTGELEHVWLTDNDEHKTVDLLIDDYVFTTAAGRNETRFVLSTELKDESTATDIPDIEAEENYEPPMKFLYHDKLYILRGGVIYDATGKRVREVNK